MKLCKGCARQNFCGNETTQDYCTGYVPQIETTMECENCPRMRLQAEPIPTKDYLPINCYVCNGSGWIAGNSYRHVAKCGRCNGTGRINYKTLTNYDWLKMASEKELAELLEYVAFDWNRMEKEDILKWLNEVHQ